jgi:cyclophilin family peptidyl-prolyl cis-trans isomerase
MDVNRFSSAVSAFLAVFFAAQMALGQGTDPDMVPPEVIMSVPGAATAPASGATVGVPGAPGAGGGGVMGMPPPDSSGGIQAFAPVGWPFDNAPPPGGVIPNHKDYSAFYNNIPQNAQGAGGGGEVNQSEDGAQPGLDAAGPFSTAGKGCPMCKKKAQEAAEKAAREAAIKQNPQAAAALLPKPDPLAVIQTTKGPITIRLFRQYVPKTVENFIDLAQKGFYNNLTWHRVVPGFVVQTGCPKGDGTGGYTDPATGQERRIPLELHQQLHHNAAGVVAMARFGSDPNSASSQFYITLTPQPKLDNKYTVFGGVVSGLDSVQKITPQDKILGITLQGI